MTIVTITNRWCWIKVAVFSAFFFWIGTQL